jgi:hypothetical protein
MPIFGRPFSQRYFKNMILHRDGLVVLEYDLASDVLYIEWPDLADYSEGEIQHSFTNLIDSIKSYDVKKLLIDSSKTRAGLTYEAYKTLMTELGLKLANTRLQRIARVEAQDQMREQLVQQFSKEVAGMLQFNIPFRNFTKLTDARDWLRSN